MGMLDDVQLKAVHASLAPVVERLSEASATLASSAVPLLGVPPATAHRRRCQLQRRHRPVWSSRRS
ncbi:hypothetical protein Y045_2727 [Burkholderia pseudomallei MSHR2451]|nr:hypothetical protein Y045_2727 [Burkholderia pseudomallei MSHR2451]